MPEDASEEVESRASVVGPSGWLLPYWLERQLDPHSPDYTPVAGTGSSPSRALPPGVAVEPTNSTHRDWTLIGSLGSWHRASVDPRGLVSPCGGGWSLDWWVRSEERWHLPSREAAVRQRLVDDTPVVETAMRVPGGDVLHRAYGARAGAEVAVVEVENASAVPVAVALAVRPYGPTGFTTVDSIELDGGATVVKVNGADALLLPKQPSQLTWSPGPLDCVTDVLEERTQPPDASTGVQGSTGLAHAAFVFPLAHTASIRVALLLDPVPVPAARGKRGREAAVSSASVAELPEASRVAAGWRTQGDRGIRLDLPDERLRQAVDAGRRHLLLVHGGEELVAFPDRPLDFAEASGVLETLDQFGYADEVEQVLSTWPERQRPDGWFGTTGDRWDANGAALHALAQHWRFTRTFERDEDEALLVARAAHAIDRKRTGSKKRGRSGAQPGLLPVGSGPDAGGAPGTWVRDAIWSCQGLHDAERLLSVSGQDDAAAAVADLRATFEHDLRVALAALPGDAWPATIERGPDGGMIANLDAVNLPLTRVGDLPGRDSTIRAIRDRYVVDDAVHQSLGPAGLSPRHTAMLGRAGMHGGDDADAELAWLTGHASATWTWPEALHPTRGGGTVGAGHDGVATAWFLRLVRDSLVREAGDHGLALCSRWPRSWLGQGLEVHGAPTWFGRFSFAIRWHGERPALLWELEPHDDSTIPIHLTVPGLDRAWSSDEAKGEALLGLPAGVTDQHVDPADLEGQSFG